MTRLYAEYEEPAPLVRAIYELRARHPVRLEVYSPYSVAAIEEALGARPSRLPYVVLAAGLGGAAGTYGLQWLLMAYLYPLNVGGRPTHFPLAFVPITFEMGVLFASFAAFGAVIVGGRLLRLWHPSREVEGIESATATSFWLEVEGTDASFDPAAATALLNRGGARVVRRGVVAP